MRYWYADSTTSCVSLNFVCLFVIIHQCLFIRVEREFLIVYALFMLRSGFSLVDCVCFLYPL